MMIYNGYIDTERQYRLVTPEQLKMGFVELRGDQIIKRSYFVVTQLASGNYVVYDKLSVEPTEPKPIVFPDHFRGTPYRGPR